MNPPAPDGARDGGPPPRLTITRTGGVGGLRIQKEIDPKRLTPGAAEAVRQCFAKLPGGESAAAPSARERGMDRFCYTVTLEDGSSRKSLTFPEGSEPPALRPLLDLWA